MLLKICEDATVYTDLYLQSQFIILNTLGMWFFPSKFTVKSTLHLMEQIITESNSISIIIREEAIRNHCNPRLNCNNRTQIDKGATIYTQPDIIPNITQSHPENRIFVDV